MLKTNAYVLVLAAQVCIMGIPLQILILFFLQGSFNDPMFSASWQTMQTQIRLILEEQGDWVNTVCHSIHTFWNNFSMDRLILDF